MSFEYNVKKASFELEKRVLTMKASFEWEKRVSSKKSEIRVRKARFEYENSYDRVLIWK